MLPDHMEPLLSVAVRRNSSVIAAGKLRPRLAAGVSTTVVPDCNPESTIYSQSDVSGVDRPSLVTENALNARLSTFANVMHVDLFSCGDTKAEEQGRAAKAFFREQRSDSKV